MQIKEYYYRILFQRDFTKRDFISYTKRDLKRDFISYTKGAFINYTKRDFTSYTERDLKRERFEERLYKLYEGSQTVNCETK